jgi:hypothetical protein
MALWHLLAGTGNTPHSLAVASLMLAGGGVSIARGLAAAW